MATNILRAAYDWGVSIQRFYRSGLLMNPYPTDGDWDPATWDAMFAVYDALVVEHGDITDALREMASYSPKRAWLEAVANEMDKVLAAVESDPDMPPEAFAGAAAPPEGGGGLPGLRDLAARRPGRVAPPVPDGVEAASTEAARKAKTPWKKFAEFASKAGILLVGLFSIVGGYAGVNIIYDKFIASPSERAARDTEWAITMARRRAEALQECPPNDQGCREGINRWFDEMMGSQECGLWQTPVADAIGGIVGVAVGYVGLRRGMGG